ncbi:MAG: YciK family oxidoreductase [Gammaproteobacteria bacterium]|nr:YciK family oxidoreductase [Gammaproteobacteria bacterium]
MSLYTPPADLLAKRTILITGAGDGIGRAAALACAAHGATIILLGRTISKLERVYDEIEQAGYPQPAIYPMNLEGATPKDYADLAATLEREFGHLDGLLHNAALLGGLSPMAHQDIDLWFKVMQVNLNAPFLLTRACLGLLMRAPDASIVFTSDQVGRRGRAYWGAYGVSKAGIEGMSQILAQELETNTHVRVNSLDPGAVRTRMRTLAYPGENAQTNPAPETLMPVYLYLLGPDSQGITGQQFEAQNFAWPATLRH